MFDISASGSASNPNQPCPPEDIFVTLKQFRLMFRAFRDSSVYPDEAVQPLLDLACVSLNRNQWRQFYRRGIGLYVAHMLSIGRMNELTAERGGAPGFGVGMIASKAINGVSVSYNTGVSIFDGAGDLNLTIYGQEFMRLVKIVGMGPVLVRGTDSELVTEADLLRGTVGPSFAGGYF